MFWRVICESADGAAAGTSNAGVPATGSDGRFVLHGHRDADGPHLDLRLEQDGHLMGWRIAAEALEGEPWATDKAPHPVRWLDQDGDAVREDAGEYVWLERHPDRRSVLLRGNRGTRVIRFEPVCGLPVSAIRSVSEALEEHGMDAGMAGRLVADGITARRRAIERFCGLGRELDGAAFEEAVWRKTLGHLTLDEIHAQLRAYEIRFDEKYPAAPVSRPERLPEVTPGDSGENGVHKERLEAGLAILKE